MASSTSSNSITSPVCYETEYEPEAPIKCGEDCNEEDIRKAFAEMFIIDGLSPILAERKKFKNLFEAIDPRLKTPSCITVGLDCVLIYKKQKQKLKDFLVRNHQRVCLTATVWTSEVGLDYVCLTAHYIDNDWRLQKKVLNFCQVEDREGDTIGKTIKACLLHWGIEKVLTVTIDNASSSDLAIAYLSKTVYNLNGTVMRSEFMQMKCFTDALNLIVMEVLEDYHEPISRIRNMVKYVIVTPLGLRKLRACAEKENISSNTHVFLDRSTRWNSTLFMLEAAEKLQKAFEFVEAQDGPYLSEFCLNEKTEVPSSADWEHGRALIKILRVFYDANLKFSSSFSVTSNSVLRELCLIHSQLRSWSECKDTYLKEMAENIKKKHEKYLGEYQTLNPYLFVAVLLDPRHKDRLLKYCFGMLYGIDMALELTNKVRNTLNELYEEYKLLYDEIVEIQDEPHITNGMEVDSSIVDVDMQFTLGYMGFLKETDGVEFKTEVDRYLMESCENPCDSSFDILAWWKANSSKYKILSYIARDVFAIPVSTAAAFESAFNVGDRILDKYRSLFPSLIEPLICSQSWLCSSMKIDLRGQMDKIEEIESAAAVDLIFDTPAAQKQERMLAELLNVPKGSMEG